MLCHLPLVLPVAGLALFLVMPFPMALALYVPLAGLSALLGVKVLAAMRQPARTGAEAMPGAEGVVVSASGRQGLARVRGELWSVEGPGSLAPGDRVTVVALRGLTALVRPAGLPARRAAAARARP